MKKLLALGFLVALLSLALTACFSAAPGNGLVGEDYGTTEQLGEGALRLGDREVWLKEATADEITELRLTCFGYVTSDDRFCSILTVTDKAELGNLLSAYGSVALTPTEAEYELTDRIYTVELVFADGSSRSMDFAGGLLYSDPAEPDGVYECQGLPLPEEIVGARESYQFLPVYDFARVWLISAEERYGLCNFTELSFLEFVRANRAQAESVTSLAAIWELDSPLGCLRFFSETLFTLDGVCYELVWQGMSDWLSPYNGLVSAHEAVYGNDGRRAFVERYYGSFEGALVAMISDDRTGYVDAIWQDTVGGLQFTYLNGNEIVVLHNGRFLTLPQALADGVLLREELALIHRLHCAAVGGITP